MIIKIDNDWQIHSDSRQWTCCKRGKSKDGTTWNPESYHMTLSHAVTWLYRRAVMSSDARSIAEAMEVQERALQRLTAALGFDYEVSVKRAAG